MQGKANAEQPFAIGQRQTYADRAAARSGKQSSLEKKPDITASIIFAVLFFCSALSILTTLAIVVVLGTEAFNFFGSVEWSNTNKRIVQPITVDQTTFEVSLEGAAVKVGDLVRLGVSQGIQAVEREIVKVVSVTDNGETVILEVERGVEGTTAVEQPEGEVLFTGIKPSIIDFFTKTKWAPQISEFGVLPLIASTVMTSAIAMLVSVPLGLGAAVYLSEYANPKVRSILKPILEILAGVPTVVYGYFALTFMTPLLRGILGSDTVSIYNMASAGLVMGIMIIPTMSSMSEDALAAVPDALRQASYGLGATRFETIKKVLLPAALSGILAAFILSVSRAVGETMIVLIAAGAGPNLTANPFDAAETMAGHIARISTGDLSRGTVDYNSVFAIGLTLFVFTLILNLISQYVSRRFREVYA